MRVLSVIHGPDVRPELFGEVIESEGHELLEWDVGEQGRPPREMDAVIVLGGAQNVGEEVRHPWLHDEYDALRDWVDRRVPTLGVCLGAQTLAYALGADVRQLSAPVVGFVPTELTDAGVADPVLGGLPRSFEAFNYNGYGFDVPEGATELATGPTCQAFRFGDRTWGVQFHPEIRQDHVLRWFADDPAAPLSLDEVRRQLDAKLARWQELGARLCAAFLAAAQNGRRPE
jgi:GMP synthase (glutamine-hydrolysing)